MPRSRSDSIASQGSRRSLHHQHQHRHNNNNEEDYDGEEQAIELTTEPIIPLTSTSSSNTSAMVSPSATSAPGTTTADNPAAMFSGAGTLIESLLSFSGGPTDMRRHSKNLVAESALLGSEEFDDDDDDVNQNDARSQYDDDDLLNEPVVVIGGAGDDPLSIAAAEKINATRNSRNASASKTGGFKNKGRRIRAQSANTGTGGSKSRRNDSGSVIGSGSITSSKSVDHVAELDKGGGGGGVDGSNDSDASSGTSLPRVSNSFPSPPTPTIIANSNLIPRSHSPAISDDAMDNVTKSRKSRTSAALVPLSKHFLVLSSAGKPIYWRHDDETHPNLSEYAGLVQAIVSYFEAEDDMITSMIAGDRRIVFQIRGPIYLMVIASLMESEAELQHQLGYVYDKILFNITGSQLERIFDERVNFDLRQLLTGNAPKPSLTN
ncbi:Vacuolar fusion protein mon1 [Blyttiomyces sp. JEL0837]|nr:Vacuolar fusion protein mon1 [Blyttiomyces sp. JEL0837]